MENQRWSLNEMPSLIRCENRSLADPPAFEPDVRILPDSLPVHTPEEAEERLRFAASVCLVRQHDLGAGCCSDPACGFCRGEDESEECLHDDELPWHEWLDESAPHKGIRVVVPNAEEFVYTLVPTAAGECGQ